MRVKNGILKMIIIWLFYFNFVMFVVKGAHLRMRPVKGITNPYRPALTQRLCGAHPRPGERCRPSVCTFVPINADASYEKMHYVPKCVPAQRNGLSRNRIPHRYMMRTGDESITSSTSVPMDVGGKTTPDNNKPTKHPVEVKCNGLAHCKVVGEKLSRKDLTTREKSAEHPAETKKTTSNSSSKKTTKKQSEEGHTSDETETTKKSTSRSTSKKTTKKESIEGHTSDETKSTSKATTKKKISEEEATEKLPQEDDDKSGQFKATHDSEGMDLDYWYADEVSTKLLEQIKTRLQRMRPMKGGTRSTPAAKKRLCGPRPQPGEDCEPSLCGVLSGHGNNPELQFLTTCVPLNVPPRQLYRSHDMTHINSQLRMALRAVITSSTSAPYDTGERPTPPDPTPVMRCHGLAVCKNLFEVTKKTPSTEKSSTDKIDDQT